MAALQVREIQHRIHELVGIPEAFGESLYVLQYAQGQARQGVGCRRAAGRRGGGRWHAREGQQAPCRLSSLFIPLLLSSTTLLFSLPQRYDVHNDHCSLEPGDFGGQQSCREFLERAGGPGCGPGAGGTTCGDRLATVILYLRWGGLGVRAALRHAQQRAVLWQTSQRLWAA